VKTAVVNVKESPVSILAKGTTAEPKTVPGQSIVFDGVGRVVFEANQGSQAAGQHSVNVNTESFASGKYYYSLTANGHRLTMKMIVTK